MRKLIIIPAYNESENLINLVTEIKSKAPGYDYIIINDGSTDDTAEVCHKANLNVVNLPLNLGIGGAVQTGYLYAYQNNYDIAIQIDGDGQHDPAYLDQLIEPIINKSADFTIGSRYINKEGFQSSTIRRAGIWWLNGIIRVLTSRKITDATSGFRAVNRDIIKLFVKYYPYDYPEPETITDICRHSFTLQEVPVIMRERAVGKSSIRFLKTIYYMIKVTLAVFVSNIKKG